MTKQLPHPTPEELNAFSLGQLSAENSATVEAHIGECPPCCETLLGLSSDDTFVAATSLDEVVFSTLAGVGDNDLGIYTHGGAPATRAIS